MFMARRERTARHRSASASSERKARWQGTLRRRYEFHLSEAVRAALQGSHDKAAGHSGQALQISRELCAHSGDLPRHSPELAAALCVHARYGGDRWQAIAMLTESAGLYADLAETDPAAYEVPRIGVLARIALEADAAGSLADAIDLLREVIDLYRKAGAVDEAEREIGLARAHFHLGDCLYRSGRAQEALAETEAGLELAAAVLDRLLLYVEVPGWFAEAPRYLQLAVPDWAAAAVRAMTLNEQAGRWRQAASSARAAVVVSGGLAELGGDTLREAHEKIGARARVIMDRASELDRSAAE